MTSIVVYEGSGEWSALYIDGILDRKSVGDHYHADERIREIFGVETRQSDAFFRPDSASHGYDDVAETLLEAEANQAIIDERLNRASDLYDQAEALRAEATHLEQEARKLEGE